MKIDGLEKMTADEITKLTATMTEEDIASVELTEDEIAEHQKRCQEISDREEAKKQEADRTEQLKERARLALLARKEFVATKLRVQ